MHVGWICKRELANDGRDIFAHSKRPGDKPGRFIICAAHPARLRIFINILIPQNANAGINENPAAKKNLAAGKIHQLIFLTK